MSVKASATVTLSSIRDLQSCTRYYLLQPSSSAKPAKPTTKPPGGSWVTMEPSYTSGSTNSLYFCDLNVFTDGDFAYSDVSLSSSYEAAKAAYIRAVSAEGTATTAQTKIDGMIVGGTNIIRESGRFPEQLDRWALNGGTVLEVVNEDSFNCLRVLGSIAQTESIYPLEWNTEYVYHTMVKFTSGGTLQNNSPLHYWFYKSNSLTSIGASNGAIDIIDYYVNSPGNKTIPSGSWCHLVIKLKTIAKPSDYSYVLFRPFWYGTIISTANNYYWVRWMQLEKGNRPTDWSPAPEEVAEEAASAQSAAESAQATADAAREDFKRVVRIDQAGLHVGDNQNTNNEVLIDSEAVNVVTGGVMESKFAGSYIQFGYYQLRRTADNGLAFKVKEA